MSLLSDCFEPWRDKAACKGLGELFFPEKRGVPTREAKDICAECPVREPCLEFALKYDERYGVWGETGPRTRRNILRASPEATPDRRRRERQERRKAS